MFIDLVELNYLLKAKFMYWNVLEASAIICSYIVSQNDFSFLFPLRCVKEVALLGFIIAKILIVEF